MATIDTFRAGWQEVTTKYAPPDPSARPVMHFSVAEQAATWVSHDVLPLSRGNIPGNVYGMALLMGAFCLYSARSDRVPYLMAPDRSAANLPLLSEYTPAATDQQLQIAVTPAIWSADAWAHFDGGKRANYAIDGGGPAREHLVHAGLHILGALTLMPAGSALAVREGTTTAGLRPPFALAGAQPFPAGIANSFSPPPTQQ